MSPYGLLNPCCTLCHGAEHATKRRARCWLQCAERVPRHTVSSKRRRGLAASVLRVVFVEVTVATSVDPLSVFHQRRRPRRRQWVLGTATTTRSPTSSCTRLDAPCRCLTGCPPICYQPPCRICPSRTGASRLFRSSEAKRDGSAEEFLFSNPGKARRYQPPPPQLLRIRRSAANERERRRMNTLNVAYDKVRAVISTCCFWPFFALERLLFDSCFLRFLPEKIKIQNFCSTSGPFCYPTPDDFFILIPSCWLIFNHFKD